MNDPSGPPAALFPSPRLRAVAWLIAPTRSIGAEGDAELRQSLIRRLPAVLASAVLTLGVTGLATYHYPTWPFLCWLALDIALASVRIPLVIRLMRWGGRAASLPSGAVDLFVCVGTLWSALLGLGMMLCLTTSDPGLSIIAALTAVGTIGAQCTRNPGAPRLNMLQMVLVVAPFSIGAAVSTIPLAIYAVALFPLYLCGMLNITRDLHADYLTQIVTRLDNRRRALHCPLTNLPNRALFNERLAWALDQGEAGTRPLAVMYLDLDGFKAVNDREGHAAGDLLLRQVGARLQDAIPSGALAARLGGDEFAVIMESDDVEAVGNTADAILAALERPFDLAQTCTVSIGASIGIATDRTAAGGRDGRIVERADAALYRAKRAGKGMVRWDGEAPAKTLGADLRGIARTMRSADAPRPLAISA